MSEWTTIRIRKTDHDRIIKRVTHSIKIHDVITKILDLSERYEKVRRAS